MDYIDFGDAVREDPDYTKGYMDGLGSVLFDVKRDSPEYYIVKGYIAGMHFRYKTHPHYHYSSILGPYCVACRCNLPGPNGEWE